MQAQCDPLIRLDFKWIYSVLFYRCESLTSMTVGHNTQSREEQIGLSRLLSHVAVQSVQQIKWRPGTRPIPDVQHAMEGAA